MNRQILADRSSGIIPARELIERAKTASQPAGRPGSWLHLWPIINTSACLNVSLSPVSRGSLEQSSSVWWAALVTSQLTNSQPYVPGKQKRNPR